MTAPLRRPGFLAAVPDSGAPRTPAFVPVAARGPARLPRLGPRPGATEPAGPTPEELAAIRAEAMERVAQGIQVMKLQAERLAEQARSDALEIGFMVARRILESEIKTSPELLFGLVRSLVRKAGDSRHLVVRVHTEDVGLVQGAVASGEAGVSAAQCEVVGDGSLERGDCVVDTDFGTVDGRIKTRLEELYRVARSALEEGQA